MRMFYKEKRKNAVIFASKRNSWIFDGEYMTITRRDNGTYRLNFKHVVVGKDFNVDGFAIGVCNELRQALTGLVER